MEVWPIRSSPYRLPLEVFGSTPATSCSPTQPREYPVVTPRDERRQPYRRPFSDPRRYP